MVQNLMGGIKTFLAFFLFSGIFCHLNECLLVSVIISFTCAFVGPIVLYMVLQSCLFISVITVF